MLVETSTKAQHMRLSVTDNGHGIPEEKLPQLGKSSVSSESGTGSALENLNRRLTGLFGNQAQLHFDSNKKGTRIYCDIPYQHHKEALTHESHHR